MNENKRRSGIIFGVTVIMAVMILLSSCSGLPGFFDAEQKQESDTKDFGGNPKPGEYLGTYNQEAAEELILLVNEIRNRNGLPPLQNNVEMNQWAQIRAAELVFVFEHTRTDGSEIITAHPDVTVRMKAEDKGFPYSSAIAIHYEDPGSAISGWMSLEHQRMNVFSEEYTHIGAACLVQGQSTFYAVVFLASDEFGEIT